MLCYEDGANECETKNWLELKIEGKIWGATAAPVQFSETWGVRLACVPFVTWKVEGDWTQKPKNLHSPVRKVTLMTGCICLSGLEDATWKNWRWAYRCHP